MDLQDSTGREERFTELCREREREIWTELQDEDWANKEFVYPFIADPNYMLADIFALVAAYKLKKNNSNQIAQLRMEVLAKILNKLEPEIERVAEFQVKQRLE